MTRHSPCGCLKQVSKRKRQMKTLQHSKCPSSSRKVTECPVKCRSFQRGWEFEEIDHGNVTSNQVILYPEIQFSGMDCVFYVGPHNSPVYPHPASQQFPFNSHFHSFPTLHPPPHGRGPHVLSEYLRQRRACRNHLSRMSEDISHQRQRLPDSLD